MDDPICILEVTAFTTGLIANHDLAFRVVLKFVNTIFQRFDCHPLTEGNRLQLANLEQLHKFFMGFLRNQ